MVIDLVMNQGRVVDIEHSNARYRLNDIFCAAWLSHAVSSVSVHKVADFIDGTPRHYCDVARDAGLHAQTLYRVMRALAANGIFEEVENGFFRHNDISLLLRSDHRHSWCGMAKMWNHPSCLSAWGKHSESLKDGRSGIEHAFGKPLYEHLHDDPSAVTAFSDAMVSNSSHASLSIARAFPFEKYSSVVDLAGGVGTLLLPILEHHKHLNGVIFEISDLEKAARENIAACNLTSRCDVACGDFFQAVPDGADLYMVKNSLWNWDDASCRRILGNVRKAIGEGRESRFLVIEYIINSDNAPWTTLYDLQILNMPGGQARTLPEYEALLKPAGFEIDSVMYVEDQTLLVARPL